MYLEWSSSYLQFNNYIRFGDIFPYHFQSFLQNIHSKLSPAMQALQVPEPELEPVMAIVHAGRASSWQMSKHP